MNEGWSTTAASFAGALAGVVVGAGGACLVGNGLQSYGTALFIALPLIQGLASGYVAQKLSPGTYGSVAAATMVGLLISGVVMLLLAKEGVICLLMAAPLIVPLVFAGAWVGWSLGGGTRHQGAALALPVVAVFGLAVGGDVLWPAQSAGEVTTVWHVAAPPERIWPYVLRLDSMAEPDWWLFRLGIAHPVRTETRLDGSRVCELSTGPMTEEVTRSEPGRRLMFRVLSTPPAMEELDPFGRPHPPHLTSVYQGREGEFVLEPESGGTRIVARSQYGLRIAPAWYWQMWSDSIVRHVHERVIGEIRRQVASRP